MEPLQYNSLSQMFFANCANEHFAGWYYRKNANWVHFSRNALAESARTLAVSFKLLNLQTGNSVGIVANSSPEWILVDIAVQINHAQVVPLFPNISAENFEYQCKDSNVRILVVNSVLDLSKDLQNLLDNFELVICINSDSTLPKNGIYFSDFLEKGNVKLLENSTWLEANIKSIQPDDIFSVVYTSGSTGLPKGVELSHRNIISQIQVIKRDFFSLSSLDVCLVVLPVAHAFERMTIYFYILNSCKVYFADSPNNATAIIREIHPTMMTVVPRILERIYESMAIASDRFHGIKKLIFKSAINYARELAPTEKRSIVWKFYDKFIYSKMRNAIGGKFSMIVSGGGALNKHICAFLYNIGVPVCEGYGLTECSPVVSVNKPKHILPGSVGMPLTHLQVKIGQNSEVLVKGDSVFKGYKNRSELNEISFTKDGFFKTGDRGYLDSVGNLFLTGRLKELLKTSTGKYVSPSHIELEISRHPLIEQALVIADNRKFASALLFLNPVNVKRFLRRSGKEFCNEKATQSKRIREAIRRHIERVNTHLDHWEQIRKWTLIGDLLTVESGLLTPTLKIRRSVAEAKYLAEIEAMYLE